LNLSVLLCTYRRPQALARALEALLAQRDPGAFEVLVVDNDPERSAREACRPYEGGSPPVLHIAAARPRNLPAARNEGIAASRAPLVGFLDDDAVPAPDWVSSVVRAHLETPRAAAIGGRVLPLTLLPVVPSRPAGPARIGRLLAFGRFTGNFDLDPGRPVPVDTVTGCNMTFRRTALERVGPFDPTYVGTTVREETDWCARATREGLPLFFDPRIVAWHGEDPRGGSRPEGGGGGGRGEDYGLYKTFWDTRNGVYFLRKNSDLGSAAALGFCAASLLSAFLGRNFFGRFRSPGARWAAAREVWKGWREGLALPLERRGGVPAAAPLRTA
jgi:GT2 family glycosyltransferase